VAAVRDHALQVRDFAASKMTPDQMVEAQSRERYIVQAPIGERLQKLMSEPESPAIDARLCQTFDVLLGPGAIAMTSIFLGPMVLISKPADEDLLRWCKTAAEAGDTESERLMFPIYQYGFVVPADKNLAID
jgi:hypothetical protein